MWHRLEIIGAFFMPAARIRPGFLAQKDLIRQFLKDMRESRDMLKYEDYRHRPTLPNSSLRHWSGT